MVLPHLFRGICNYSINFYFCWVIVIWTPAFDGVTIDILRIKKKINEENAMDELRQISHSSLSMIDFGENFLWVALGVSIIAIILSSLTKVFGLRSKQIEANAFSADSLYKELNSELKKAKWRQTMNQIEHNLFSLISIVGGIVVSTVFFQNSFPKQIGTIGFIILLSSLLRLFFHPLENYQRAKRDVVFLKAAEREYGGIDTPEKATSFLRKKLNEYDKLSLSE